MSSLPRIAGAFAVLLVFVAASGTALAEASGRCHSVVVSSDLVLPDGSVHGPGVLTACDQRAHSPTTTLLELSIDSHPVHMVISRSGRCEAPEDVAEPFFVFHLDASNRLVLQGYVVPKRGDLLTYAMHPNRDHYEVTSSWIVLAQDYSAGAPQDPSAILVAANR
jgi:hypothetical protein